MLLYAAFYIVGSEGQLSRFPHAREEVYLYAKIIQVPKLHILKSGLDMLPTVEMFLLCILLPLPPSLPPARYVSTKRVCFYRNLTYPREHF